MKSLPLTALALSRALALITGLCVHTHAEHAEAAEVSYAIHAEGSAARMVGDRKVDQFGWGGGGLVAPELTIGPHFGVELPMGGLVLSDGSSDEMGVMETEGGFGLFALPGVRVRPFGRALAEGGAVIDPGGLWLAGGAGMAYTGDLARAAVDARIGYDLFSSELFRGGPHGGYLQIVETSSEVRPEDARIVMFGLHGAFEPQRKVRKAQTDRDGDGIHDGIDGCPDVPEDDDGFEDLDGCPDEDNDRDGIVDLDDKCPNKAEDKDQFEDEDGCPDLDNDADTIVDKRDKCPLVAEDPDGFEDEDGCPDYDNDGDGILDGDDKCPDEDETFNDYADDDGCPDTVLARVVGDEILLDERVYFHVNSHKVAVRSWPLLQAVAKLLGENVEYTLVRVQGHADDTGEDEWNQKLSERRSHAVRDMLIQFGVAETRLIVEGFGEHRPQQEETTVYARRKNRRVEFLILARRRAGDPPVDKPKLNEDPRR